MNPEKIVLFVPNLEGGGAERMMVNLVNSFERKGFNANLLLARKTGPYVKLVNKNVKIFDLKISFLNPLFLYHLFRFFKKEKPDIVLSAMTLPNVAVLLVKRLAMSSSKVYISERVAMGVQSKNSSSLKETLKPIVARLTYNWADHIIAISNGVSRNLIDTIGISEKKITTIYNPVVTSQLFKTYPKPSHPFFNMNHRIILGAGRLVPQKDFKTLIHAFSMLVKQSDIRLIILGDGPQKKELAQLIEQLGLSEKISLPGYVEDLFAYMNHASLFVLSSRWEGFGNVLVEAMAMGCPVVSTNCPSGPAEILSDGKYGELVDIENPEALAKAISNALVKDKNEASLKERANAFSSDVISSLYLEIMIENN